MELVYRLMHLFIMVQKPTLRHMKIHIMMQCCNVMLVDSHIYKRSKCVAVRRLGREDCLC
ncbi:hypothetical protein Hanom_Chr10g00879991 [Helianthus anomalus]